MRYRKKRGPERVKRIPDIEEARYPVDRRKDPQTLPEAGGNAEQEKEKDEEEEEEAGDPVHDQRSHRDRHRTHPNPWYYIIW